MSVKLVLRYQKKDRFGNEVFIANVNCDEEKESFSKLKTLAGKIDDLGLSTFNPIYNNDVFDYSTIRFKFYKGIRLDELNLYTVDFIVKKSKRDNKEYVNCFINSIKLYKRAPMRDDGELLDFNM